MLCLGLEIQLQAASITRQWGSSQQFLEVITTGLGSPILQFWEVARTQLSDVLLKFKVAATTLRQAWLLWLLEASTTMALGNSELSQRVSTTLLRAKQPSCSTADST